MPPSTKTYAPNPEDEDNPLYKTDQFRMYCLKVLPCSRRYVHDWTTCPFAHNAEKAKRRDPRVYNYTGVACPDMKKSMQCPRGDQCPYAHNVFEYWLHHSRYRTQLCNDGVGCKRKICFFAHTLDELRVSNVKVQVPEGHRESSNGCINPFAPSPSSASHGSKGAHSFDGGKHGANNSPDHARAGLPPFTLADLQQLQHQQAAAALGASPFADLADPANEQAALEHLVHLMAIMQQQQHMQAQPTPEQVVAMQQLLLAQQQAQAVAELQAQQQLAALHLLSQMQGGTPHAGNGYGMHDPFSLAASAAALAACNAAGAFPGMPPQAHNGFHQGQGFAHPNNQQHAPAGARPNMQTSALTAGLSAQQQRGASPPHHPMDELARQLSTLSTSSQVQLSPVGGMGPPSDGPSSARSHASSCTPPGKHRMGGPRASLPSNDAGGSHAMSMFEHGLPMSGLLGKGGHMETQLAGLSGPGASLMHHSLGSSRMGGPMQHTSPVSISALADGYTTATATANSFLSNSLASSHDGSDI